jgi:hypothetical protein
MSDQTNNDRKSWIRGEKPQGAADEFAAHATRGRQELASEQQAEALLQELDEMLVRRFGAGDSGAAAGAMKEPPRKGSAKIRSLARYYSAAAVILLLVAAGYWWATNQPAFDPETVYADTFTPYANELSSRSMGEAGEASDDTLVGSLSAALLAYDRQDYATAADSFAVYLSTAPAAAPQLYYGISLLASGQTDAAIAVLTPLQKEQEYTHPASWYSALALVRKGDTVAARIALKAIAKNEKSPFRSRAQSLLRMIS